MPDPADILLPPEVATARLNALMDQLAAEQEETGRKWEKEIQRVDPSLRLRFFGERAPDIDLPILPGHWHLIRTVAGEMHATIPLSGPNGEYVTPGSWLFDYLSEADMWNPRVHRHHKEVKRKMREARQRAIALDREQRRDEMGHAAKAAMRLRSNAGMTQRTDLKGKPTKSSVVKP